MSAASECDQEKESGIIMIMYCDIWGGGGGGPTQKKSIPTLKFPKST